MESIDTDLIAREWQVANQPTNQPTNFTDGERPKKKKMQMR